MVRYPKNRHYDNRPGSGSGGGGGGGGNWLGNAVTWNTPNVYPPATAAWQTWEFQSMLTMPDGLDYPAGTIAVSLPGGGWRMI